jgi:uncharacterized protein involved in tolerance to divalent cations
MIHTNLDTENFHDAIAYPTIEKQVYDLFANKVSRNYHCYGKKGTTLVLNGYECPLEFKKKSVQLTVYPVLDELRGDGFPFIRIPFNKDVAKQIDKFCTILIKMQPLEEKAKAIIGQSPSQKTIEAFLNQELGTDRVEVKYWNGNILRRGEVQITFYLKSKDAHAPADGSFMCIEKDGQTINPYWNHSTPQRSGGSSKHTLLSSIERAVGNKKPTASMEAMKEKMKRMEELEKKIKEFDPTKSPALMKLFEIQKEADLLIAEFDALTS